MALTPRLRPLGRAQPHIPRRAVRAAVQRDPFASLFSSLDAQLDALEADVRRLDAEADALRARGERSREWSSERVDVGPHGRSVTRSYSRIIVSGPPVTAPAPPTLFSGGAATIALAVLLGAWGAVAAKLWRGFGATRYKQAARLPFSAAWPLLAAGSSEFRDEMKAALDAGKEVEAESVVVPKAEVSADKGAE